MSLKNVRVRFAPSPTGNLHIGSVRTALFNYLMAKHYGGICVLRIEDTDQKRSEEKFEATIMQGLEWLGLTMDEGPHNLGKYGPYRQSERVEQGAYISYVDQLIKEGHAYYCFESEADLDQERKDAEEQGIPYKYSRKSLYYSPKEVAHKRTKGEPHVVRFKVPDSGFIQIDDMVKGSVSFENNLISDFIIMKSDGMPAYNFAVVVDDIEMKITHVLRGEDHLSNTARQYLLFQALSKPIPSFAHLPIILGSDRSKLSKRHGAQSVTDYKEMGYLPKAVLNYLSLLGWSPLNGEELLSQESLIKQFDIKRISKSGAIFDLVKLKWMNGQYIRKLSSKVLKSYVTPFLSEGIKAKWQEISEKKKLEMLESIQDNLGVLSEINKYLEVYFISQEEYLLNINEKPLSIEQKHILNVYREHLTLATPESPEAWQSFIDHLVEQLSLGRGKVMKMVRFSSTGFFSGPDLKQVLSVIGKDKILERFLDNPIMHG